MANKNEIYNKGEQVPNDGHYVCSPCGFKKHFHAGEKFGECTSCMAGSVDGDPQFLDGSGLWEKYRDEK